MTILKTSEKKIIRPPIVAIMGHIDHGKSTLLDYIRKTNIVKSEAGGITQHIAAYEAEYKNKKITFIDTPGHEAFSAARARGANIADIAVLIVAADDGVSTQTISALKFIRESKTPFIIAINKIDKENANIEKTKNSLLENEIYLEGMGGDISYNEISALTGKGVNELLETILLVSEIEDLKTNISDLASGFILESKKDSKKGISATLIIKDGSLKTGQYIASSFCFSPIRILEDFNGKKIKEASASMPVNISGFNSIPNAGDSFIVFNKKKDAQKDIEILKKLKEEQNIKKNNNQKINSNDKINVLPLIIKADVSGSLDAIKYELKKNGNEKLKFKIINEGCGDINESDIKNLGGIKKSTIIGFNVKVEKNAQFLADNLNIEIKTFKIIYELIEFLEKRLKKLTPKERIKEVVGEAKILRVFSWIKKGGVIGGEVKIGEIKQKNILEIFRRNEYIGTATIKEMQFNKKSADTVAEGNQFGIDVLSKLEIVEGDIIKSIEIIEK